MIVQSGERYLQEMSGNVRTGIQTHEFHHQMLVGLRSIVGCDGAAFRPGARWPGSNAYYLDEDPRFTDGYIRKAELYRPEVSRWCDLSKGEHAFIDTEIYSGSERRKKALYADVITANRVRSIMGCPLTAQGQQVGLVLLFRTGRSPAFSSHHALSLDPLLRGLALAEIAIARTQLSPGLREKIHALSPRLDTIFHQLLTGKSEKDIGVCLALSARTVHKYTESIFRLFHVNSRAEFMALFVNRHPQ